MNTYGEVNEKKRIKVTIKGKNKIQGEIVKTETREGVKGKITSYLVKGKFFHGKDTLSSEWFKEDEIIINK